MATRAATGASGRFHTAVGERKVLLGVVHLAPLPGSPRYDGRGLEPIVERAHHDAVALLDAGFDGWLLENLGDAPFLPDRVPAHVIAAMTRIACELPREVARVTGVNVLRNDARGGMAVAAAAGLDFIRVNVHSGATVADQGVVEGRAHETLRDRALLGAPVAVLADVDVKHATPLGRRFDLVESARDTVDRGLADALIVTGKATGGAVSFGHLRLAREAVPDRPLLVGSGVTTDNAADLLAIADGAIVGTSLKEEGDVRRPVDPERARAFVHAVRG
ncbi:MAG: BtpA/SgcQ family protein [Myxococcota bacterium]